jgi:hypothetical protein
MLDFFGFVIQKRVNYYIDSHPVPPNAAPELTEIFPHRPFSRRDAESQNEKD